MEMLQMEVVVYPIVWRVATNEGAHSCSGWYECLLENADVISDILIPKSNIISITPCKLFVGHADLLTVEESCLGDEKDYGEWITYTHADQGFAVQLVNPMTLTKTRKDLRVIFAKSIKNSQNFLEECQKDEISTSICPSCREGNLVFCLNSTTKQFCTNCNCMFYNTKDAI